jgi:hypothetical protein
MVTKDDDQQLFKFAEEWPYAFIQWRSNITRAEIDRFRKEFYASINAQSVLFRMPAFEDEEIDNGT